MNRQTRRARLIYHNIVRVRPPTPIAFPSGPYPFYRHIDYTYGSYTWRYDIDGNGYPMDPGYLFKGKLSKQGAIYAFTNSPIGTPR